MPGGRLSYSANAGSLTYALSAQATPAFYVIDRTEIFSTPAGTPFERQEEVQGTKETEYFLNGSLSYSFANGDIVNLNGRYGREGPKDTENSNRFVPGQTREHPGQRVHQRVHRLVRHGFPLITPAAQHDGIPFRLEPATDDRPYFHHFLSYRRLGAHPGHGR